MIKLIIRSWYYLLSWLWFLLRIICGGPDGLAMGSDEARHRSNIQKELYGPNISDELDKQFSKASGIYITILFGSFGFAYIFQFISEIVSAYLLAFCICWFFGILPFMWGGIVYDNFYYPTDSLRIDMKKTAEWLKQKYTDTN